MPQTIRDLIQALQVIREVASSVEAWNDNDGEPSLNSFARSGVGGRRSEALMDPIADARSIASEVLRFTVDGRLDKNQANALRDAEFPVLAGEEGFVKVGISPTAAAYADHEAENEDGESDSYDAPEDMELILIQD